MTDNDARTYLISMKEDNNWGGSIPEALELAIKALGDVQKYRAMEEKLNGLSIEQVVEEYMHFNDIAYKNGRMDGVKDFATWCYNRDEDFSRRISPEEIVNDYCDYLIDCDLRQPVDLDSIALKLVRCFPGSFINYNNEFIAHKYSNTYFILGNCKSELDVKCKVLEWFSRAAFKTEPYENRIKNQEFQEFMLDGINSFLGTAFTKEDIEEIYIHLGNAVNHDLTVQFVENGYDMQVLEKDCEKERDL